MTVQLASPRSHFSTPLLDRSTILSLRALTRFMSTRTFPSMPKPYSAPLPATWAAYALATSVFVGMHPVLMHVPPNLCLSIIATLIPAAEKRAAKDGPAWPVPMMMASNFCVITVILPVSVSLSESLLADRAEFRPGFPFRPFGCVRHLNCDVQECISIFRCNFHIPGGVVLIGGLVITFRGVIILILNGRTVGVQRRHAFFRKTELIGTEISAFFRLRVGHNRSALCRGNLY